MVQDVEPVEEPEWKDEETFSARRSVRILRDAWAFLVLLLIKSLQIAIPDEFHPAFLIRSNYAGLDKEHDDRNDHCEAQ